MTRKYLQLRPQPPTRNCYATRTSLVSVIVDVLHVVQVTVSLVSIHGRHQDHRAASLDSVTPDCLGRHAGRCIARFFLSTTAYPLRRWLYRSFLSPADATSAAQLAASLVSFSRRRQACRATRFIARFFLYPTPCSPRHSLHRSFLSLADALPAVPLAASLVSFTRRRHARAARCIAAFFLFPTSCRPCRSLYRSLLSLGDTLPVAPLAESLVPFSRRRHARSAARYTARFFLFSTPCPPRRSLNRSFLSPADDTPAAPLVAPCVSFSFRRLVGRATR
jgi:hypothetical protein